MDILVYPRRRSRQTELVTPLKPLEAMAMEKAILASNVAGLKELLSAECAGFCEPDHPDDLARECLKLIGDPARRGEIGRRAREHVMQERQWSQLTRIYLDIYRSALSARQRTRPSTAFNGLSDDQTSHTDPGTHYTPQATG
jgi:glycosyltransferase involved in cell wall biosynthesis